MKANINTMDSVLASPLIEATVGAMVLLLSLVEITTGQGIPLGTAHIGIGHGLLLMGGFWLARGMASAASAPAPQRRVQSPPRFYPPLRQGKRAPVPTSPAPPPDNILYMKDLQPSSKAQRPQAEA